MKWGNRDESRERTDQNQANSTPAHLTASTRRTFLELAGVSATILGGTTLGSSAVAAQDSGPSTSNDWSLAFDDQFESDELDESKWNIGWGWGRTSTTSKVRITRENVGIENDELRLSGTHNGNDIRSGAVNTRETMTFGPGTYLEARLKFPNRVGFHSAFWAKPTEFSWWPPEIDVVEILQNGSGEDDTHISRHFLHYPTSTQPGDASTHKRLKAHSRPGDDLTKNFHVYAAEWQPNGITMYFDGNEVQTFTNDKMLESMEKAAPFYLNIDQNIYINSPLREWVGSADLSEQWGEETVIDWVRIWKR